jgi:hypothetical protein
MGVALHTRSQPVGSGGPALTRPLAEALEQLAQCGDPRLVRIVDDEFADTGLKGDRYRTACTASALVGHGDEDPVDVP